MLRVSRKGHNFEKMGGVSCFTIDDEGILVPDKLKDDYSVVINLKDKGIVVITGCGHAGPVNIIKPKPRC